MTVAAAGVLARSLASATLGGRRRFPETPLPPDGWDELVAVVANLTRQRHSREDRIA